jgi:glucan phosphoethanolaminetransferase (alkaline phosphatase superfamily)
MYSTGNKENEMREQSKISIIIIISVVIVMLFASYRDYKNEANLNNFLTEIDSQILSKYKEKMSNNNYSGLFDSLDNNSLTIPKPNFINSLLDVVTVDNLLLGILLGWLISIIILKKIIKPKLIEGCADYQLKQKTFKLSLIWFNVFNIVFFFFVFILTSQFSYFMQFYDINSFIVVPLCLVNIILSVISILTYFKKEIIFWYTSTLVVLQVLLIKIFFIVAILKELGIDSIPSYFGEIRAIVVILILFCCCIHYVKKWLTQIQKKNIINICGFIISGLLLLMFLEVL